MNKLKKIFFGVLLSLLLIVTAIPIPLVNLFRVEAAVKAPDLSDNKMVYLLVNGRYQIKLLNVMKTAKITYQSVNEVAVVDKKGKVTGKNLGYARIIVKVVQGGKTYQLYQDLIVTEPSVFFTEATDYLNVGQNYTFQTNTLGLKEKVKYSVSDTNIATIDDKGTLSAVAAGSVKVYATAGKVRNEHEITVGTNRLGTYSTNITLYEDKTIYINVKDTIKDEEIIFSNDNTDVVSCTWGEWIGDRSPMKLKVEGMGSSKIIISTKDGKEKLYLNVTVLKKKSKKELSAKELYAQCGPSTVEIVAADGSSSSLGSGFFVADNVVVTNYHVISGAKKITVTTKDEKIHEVKTILGYDENLDLAVLQTEGKGYTPLALASEAAAVGETIYALGSPLGLTGTMTSGMISTDSRVLEGVDYIQITAPLSSGNSGGPLTNSYGEVIGVNTMYYANGQNLNFSINIKELEKINTNRPISVEDYYKDYKEKLLAKIEANKIQEDPTKSQNRDTCQEIPSLSKVVGTITAAEGGDLYRFTVNEPGWFYGELELTTLDDFKNGYFILYNSKLEEVAGCYEDEKKLLVYTKSYLTPGDYYVYACATKNYTGPDIPYSFMIYYK